MSKSKGVDVADMSQWPEYGPERKNWGETISDVAWSLEGDLLISPPVRDPLYTYVAVNAHVSGPKYQVPSTGLTEEQQESAQKETLDLLQGQQRNFIGYQANMYMPQCKRLSPYLDFHSNNVGDAFTPGSFTMNVKWMECNVLDYYASLWNARWPYKLEDPESYWGYVLTMGSTEGNLYAAWNARDYLSGKYLYYDPRHLNRALAKSTIEKENLVPVPQAVGCTYAQAKLPDHNPNAYSPVVFYSEDTHYSNIKATQTIDIPAFCTVGESQYPGQCPLGPEWPCEVPSKDGALGPGTIDIDALCTLVQFFVKKGHPIFVVLNYGSTFKGAYDDVEEVTKRLKPILSENGMLTREVTLANGIKETRNGYWIHVDGALGASYMPFVNMASKSCLRPGLVAGPKFDFSLPMVSSIVASGHKWPGAPWPCGVYMTRNKYRIKPPEDTPMVIGSPDTTFAGSRNATSAAVLWTYISTHSYSKQVEKVLHCLDVVNYAYAELIKLQRELGKDLWVTHSQALSLSVHIKRPNEKISYKYSLSDEEFLINGTEQRTYAHIYCMENVTYSMIDQLIEDLRAPDAFPDQNPKIKANSMLEWVQRKKSQNIKYPTPLHHIPAVGRGWK